MQKGEKLVTSGSSVLPSESETKKENSSTDSVFVFPLSSAQRRLWFLDRFEPGSALYNMAWPMRIQGLLDTRAFIRSVQKVVERHEILRTTFQMIDDEPVQVISIDQLIEIPVDDFSAMDVKDREKEVRKLSSEEARKPFDLAKGPLIRVKLLRLSEEEHVLLLTMHHIVSDGWSMSVFFRELGMLYESYSSGKEAELSELPIQYADYAVWQKEWFQGERLEQQLRYWKDQLGGSLPILEMPTDHPRPAVQTFRGSLERFRLSRTELERLKDFCQESGVTLFMLLLAVFKALLYRYTGQEEIVVGTPIAGRNRSELEGLIGFFVNTLVLRTGVSGSMTFGELLGQVREVALGGYSHQDVPFEKLVEELKPERSLSHTPLFQVMFSLQNVQPDELEFSELALTPMPAESGTEQFDLFLSFDETSEGLEGLWSYNLDLFEASTIARLLKQYERLLASAIENPDLRVSDLPILSNEERRCILVDWNDTRAEYPADSCIHQLFERQVALTPQGVALQWENKQWSYDDLNCRANRLAHYLIKLSVGREVRVAIFMDRSLEMIVGLLAVLKAGGVYVPIDPDLPRDRVTFILQDSEAAIVLTQKRFVAQLASNNVSMICLDSEGWRFTRESKEKPGVTTSCENLAYIIYTSGSTGFPKGVMIEHRSLVNLATAAIVRYGIKSSDRVLQFASISFDTAAEEIYSTLACGATLILRTDSMIDSRMTFLDRCREWGITVLDLPTSYWHELTEKIATEHLRLPEALRLVIVGGEKALSERIADWARHVDGRVELMNGYGPTETTVTATVVEPLEDNQASEINRSSIGRPLQNVEAYILDPYLEPVPIGVSGELYIGGLGVARGYIKRPSLTAEMFIPNPFCEDGGSRLYKTGDLAQYKSDGTIDFLGRKDNQVKLRGFRIELGEIEESLIQMPNIKDAVVLLREDTPGLKRLVGYIVPRNKSVPSYEELRSFLKQKLPDFMIPSAFVPLDELPHSPTGKIDRRSLPAPENVRLEFEREFVPAQTPLEIILAQLWCYVLGVERIGVHDNFFEFGGHSLLATRLMSRLRKMFQMDLPLRKIFEIPTISAFAVMMLSDASAAERIQRTAQTILSVEQLTDVEAEKLLLKSQQQEKKLP